METTSAAVGTSAGSSSANDATASSASSYDEDAASRHFATTASQVPVPTGSISPSTVTTPPAAALPSIETSVKDIKNHGTRFHEECHETDIQPSNSMRLKSSRIFKGKGKETLLPTSQEEEQQEEEQKKEPLNLLDLPVDILKEIVKEVTHTNDLTSLALCHSALHRLTTPHIYSRFDIVWPDTNTHAEPRSGVDALTYGLATLVMAEEIFGEAPHQRQWKQPATHDNLNRFTPRGHGKASDMTIRRRRGNHYAHFTRKFSLGNGPADWVQEYLITKEGGKMLGTLVALAVARMRSLETFVWDMPTGILRDVWLALSSLGDRNDGEDCRLEKVWVRWHDNSSVEAPPPPPPPPPAHPHPATNTSSLLPPPQATSVSLPPPPHHTALDRIEHPSFSVLPALKSLSVLDIDELAYLDEMAVLIGRSLHKLRELRVGIARHAVGRDWVTVWEGEGVQQVDHNYPTMGSVTIGEKRLGGVMGVLTGFVCDMKAPKVVIPDRSKRRSGGGSIGRAKSPARINAGGGAMTVNAEAERAEPSTAPDAGATTEITSLRDMFAEVPAGEAAPLEIAPVSPQSTRSLLGSEPSSSSAFENDPLVAQCSIHSTPLLTPSSEEPQELIHNTTSILDSSASSSQPINISAEPPERHSYLDNKLHLESLELERVPLSVPLLQKAIDWTRLTSLTLLHCHNHEQLWKTLRRQFAPTPRSPTYPHPRRTITPSAGPSNRRAIKSSYAGSDVELEYGLKLKKIHTNTVSPSLISFLRDTLAPNSLEVLFLQEAARGYQSNVTIDQIFKGPLRRHRKSLKKVLVDSSEKAGDGGVVGVGTGNGRWRRWLLSREVLGFVCSGKMPALRELGAAVDYRDWHFLLQSLPSIPHLRSLSIPFLADHVHGADVDPRELALQIVDIVALRPEVELCYMGIAGKCFEILENRRNGSDGWDGNGRPESRLGPHGAGGLDNDDDGAAASDGEDEDDGDAEDVAEEDEEEDAEAESESDDDDEDDDEDDDTDSEAGSSSSSAEENGRGAARLRLREILFYDDKVAIFKARHGRL